MASQNFTAAAGRLGDRLAVGASLTCLVHCLFLPLVVAALPSISSMIRMPEAFHVIMVAVALPLSLGALISGRARHGYHVPILVGAAGLALMALALFLPGERLETYVTVAGSVGVVLAHALNLRLTANIPRIPARL